MANPEMLKRFRGCVRYQGARWWQKPFFNPRRFLANQLRKRGFLSGIPGEIGAVPTFHLVQFAIVEGEMVSQQIASYGVYEPDSTEAFLHLIKPGQVVLDIGMHLGYYATLFAALVEKSGEVHAFEPTSSTREIALLNTKRFLQIQVHPLAVWSSPRTLLLRDYGPKWMGFNSLVRVKLDEEPAPPKEIEVQTTTLDEFRSSLRRPVALIKIDAESAERDIVRGAKGLLERDQPVISAEVGDRADSKESRLLVEDLIVLGYTPWEFRSGRFRRHQTRERYAYDNLIFAPASRDLSELCS